MIQRDGRLAARERQEMLDGCCSGGLFSVQEQ